MAWSFLCRVLRSCITFFFKGVETKIWRKICHSCVHLWLLLLHNGEVLQISFMIQSFIFFFLGFLQLWSKQNLQKRVNAASHNHSQWMAWFHSFVYCIFGCGYFPGMVPEAVFMIVFIGLFGPSCVSLYSFFFLRKINTLTTWTWCCSRRHLEDKNWN